jgi:hypothetical protein
MIIVSQRAGESTTYTPFSHVIDRLTIGSDTGLGKTYSRCDQLPNTYDARRLKQRDQARSAGEKPAAPLITGLGKGAAKKQGFGRKISLDQPEASPPLKNIR